MKIKNDKEVIFGKIFKAFGAKYEVPFFVKNIVQLSFSPYNKDENRYSVLIKTPLSNDNETIYITKEKYEYLLEKLGANEDED